MDFAVDDLANAGTGGTIGGVSHALKSEDASVKVFLVDPPGSGLYNKVTRGVMYAREEAEQTRLRNPADTITEGVGINRVTANFARSASRFHDVPYFMAPSFSSCSTYPWVQSSLWHMMFLKVAQPILGSHCLTF